jgi:uncharacterized protein YpmS
MDVDWKRWVFIAIVLAILVAIVFVAPINCCTSWSYDENESATQLSEKKCQTLFQMLTEKETLCPGVSPVP